MRDGAKPVIEVSLLPAEWGEDEYQNCFNALLAGARSVPSLEVETENDLIVLFPKDAMQKGLGTEIVIRVDLSPHSPSYSRHGSEIARTFFNVMQELVPNAYILCRVGGFDSMEVYTREDTDEVSEEQVLRVLKEHPGSTATAVAKAIGEKYGTWPRFESVLSTLEKLKTDGVIQTTVIKAPPPFASKQGWKLV